LLATDKNSNFAVSLLPDTSFETSLAHSNNIAILSSLWSSNTFHKEAGQDFFGSVCKQLHVRNMCETGFLLLFLMRTTGTAVKQLIFHQRRPFLRV